MSFNIYSINNKKTQNLFLKLPSLIYSKSENPQNRKIEKQILNNTHTISKDITVYPVVITTLKNTPICRCLITYYDNDDTAYVGFFEAKQSQEAVKLLFKTVEQKIKQDGKTKILGPIDASIYINYRFKTNLFDRTYTNEPYNKEYYPQMWEDNGFDIEHKYISNQLRQVKKEDFDPRLEKLYKRYVEKGMEFITPSSQNFEKCVEDIYELLMKTYMGFPGYKLLSKEQFLELYLPLRKVINFNMMCLAYQENKLCAFCICIPNYKELTRGKITLVNLYKILKIKKKPKEYILLYAGADPSKAGLGSALLQFVCYLLYQNKQTCITALIKEGNLTGKLYKQLYEEQYQYVLFSKHIE
jgi:hypothetical protein